jgi:hypothetical protein
MKMVEVNIGDLIGGALDWAVATLEGLPIRLDPMAFGSTANGGYWVWGDKLNGTMLKIGPADSPSSRNASGRYSPSTNWNQLGPLITKYPIILGNHESGREDGTFWGSAHCFHTGTSFETYQGVLVAACRSLVAYDAYKRGADVRVIMVPAILVPAVSSPQENNAGGNSDE